MTASWALYINMNYSLQQSDQSCSHHIQLLCDVPHGGWVVALSHGMQPLGSLCMATTGYMQRLLLCSPDGVAIFYFMTPGVHVRVCVSKVWLHALGYFA